MLIQKCAVAVLLSRDSVLQSKNALRVDARVADAKCRPTSTSDAEASQKDDANHVQALRLCHPDYQLAPKAFNFYTVRQLGAAPDTGFRRDKRNPNGQKFIEAIQMVLECC